MDRKNKNLLWILLLVCIFIVGCSNTNSVNSSVNRKEQLEKLKAAQPTVFVGAAEIISNQSNAVKFKQLYGHKVLEIVGFVGKISEEGQYYKLTVYGYEDFDHGDYSIAVFFDKDDDNARKVLSVIKPGDSIQLKAELSNVGYENNIGDFYPAIINGPMALFRRIPKS